MTLANITLGQYDPVMVKPGQKIALTNLHYIPIVNKINTRTFESRRTAAYLMFLLKLINGFISWPQLLSLIHFYAHSRSPSCAPSFHSIYYLTRVLGNFDLFHPVSITVNIFHVRSNFFCHNFRTIFVQRNAPLFRFLSFYASFPFRTIFPINYNNFLNVSNDIELRSFCTLNHRWTFSNGANAWTRGTTSPLPFSFAVPICIKPSLLSPLSRRNHCIASVYVRFLHCCQHLSNLRALDNFQYHVLGF